MLKNKYFRALVSAVFWIGIWWILAAFVDKEVLLPSPLQTMKALLALASGADFWRACFSTLARVVIGFTAGVMIGSIIGFITYKYDAINMLLRPLQSVIKATPVASFIIISLVWLGKSRIPSFISFLIVTPIVWSSVNSSLNSCNKKLLEAADIFNVGLIDRIRYIYIPSIKKDYLAALETCFGLAWKSGVAAEVLALPHDSVGKELYNSKIYLESDKMFAWTMSIVIISFFLEIYLKKLLSRILSLKRRNNA